MTALSSVLSLSNLFSFISLWFSCIDCLFMVIMFSIMLNIHLLMIVMGSIVVGIVDSIAIVMLLVML